MPCAYLRGAVDWGSNAYKLRGGRTVPPTPQDLPAANNLASSVRVCPPALCWQ